MKAVIHFNRYDQVSKYIQELTDNVIDYYIFKVLDLADVEERSFIYGRKRTLLHFFSLERLTNVLRKLDVPVHQLTAQEHADMREFYDKIGYFRKTCYYYMGLIEAIRFQQNFLQKINIARHLQAGSITLEEGELASLTGYEEIGNG